jgi:hypothetical protein
VARRNQVVLSFDAHSVAASPDASPVTTACAGVPTVANGVASNAPSAPPGGATATAGTLPSTTTRFAPAAAASSRAVPEGSTVCVAPKPKPDVRVAMSRPPPAASAGQTKLVRPEASAVRTPVFRPVGSVLFTVRVSKSWGKGPWKVPVVPAVRDLPSQCVTVVLAPLSTMARSQMSAISPAGSNAFCVAWR